MAPIARPAPVVLVRLHRGGVLESVHRGSLAVVAATTPDDVVLSRGDVEQPVFYRSTAKPLQALPLVATGAADAFGLTEAEIALASGSHSGSPEHVATARSILAKAGLDERALQCGGHWSGDAEIAAGQRAAAKEPLRVFSNCSGKHAGMLATAKHLGAPLDTYRSPGHPVQRAILAHVATLGGLPESSVRIAVDGCGAPTFAVPLTAMARSFARLGAPDGLPEDVAAAARRIGDAMRAHPEMVAGAKRFDTDLMLAARGRVLCKAGAEGVHALALPERGTGLAVKCEDGSDRGYRIVVLETLRAWGILTEAEVAVLAARHAATVLRNFAGEEVGRMEAVLDDEDPTA